MKVMLLKEQGKPLEFSELPQPKPGPNEVLIQVHACGVCRTDLHVADGDLKKPAIPLILGHQIVGTIVEIGPQVSTRKVGERVGVPWLGGCCFECSYCLEGHENLCDRPTFTGYQKNGGFAEYAVANEEFLLPIPGHYDDIHAAPLLCAGLIGYRAFSKLGEAKRVGFYGFGSSAHLLIQYATAIGAEIYVFTRPHDLKTQAFAKKLGAVWAGDSNQTPKELLDGALIFAPVGELYIPALKAIRKGGKVISAGIHMSDIPSFPYELLWGERSMSSVANLTRQDGLEWMAICDKISITPEVEVFPLEKANEALAAIREGKNKGSVVLKIRTEQDSNLRPPA